MNFDLIMTVDFGYIFRQQKVGLVQISIANVLQYFFLIIDNNPAPEAFLHFWKYSRVLYTHNVYVLNFLFSQSVSRSK